MPSKLSNIFNLGRPDTTAMHNGYGYTLIRVDGKWQAKLILPLRPLVFKKDFEQRSAAEDWMKNIINNLEVA